MQTKNTADKLKKELERARARKVASLKNKIESGNYQVSNIAVAKALFLAQ